MLSAVFFSFLLIAPAAHAVAAASRREGLAPHGLGGLLHAPGRRDYPHRNTEKVGKSLHTLALALTDSQKLVSRQSSAPITTDPDCTLYDGYFYLTPQNYTWQLQCANTYDGAIIAQTTDTTDLGSCIEECINYNRQNTPGACLAVTFNGAYDTADTVCTQFGEVDSVGIASEEGAHQPEPEPSFSGEPTQGPTVVPVPTSTTTTLAVITTASAATTTTSTLALTSNSPTVSTSYAVFTTTTTSTGTVFVTSCVEGSALCQYSSTSSSTGGLGSSTSTPQTTSVTSINISDGGSRPATSMAPVTTTSTAGAFTFDAGQTTLTNILPFTEYRLQIIEVCAATPTTCSESTSTATSIGLITQISCSPGPCIGVAPATGFLVEALATGTCIVP
ncbi:uncharacterized protein Z520_07151 [Fonsecaea multimorphosa CBS 102226]|uniref:Apple domain-containing protein n=1 Tax=Fonsecaea multimorphosa CBS 102226 TaxID=1442371 RepID=A0A0D2JU64_9EURO|nr:uncharacterized protein Z520_07151 [Fonsecaea multimorphosa CBS 102226]KIX97037.1 hypothetical protein Z520_07151 [Fonsecaea multimorphosa CBS 102226]